MAYEIRVTLANKQVIHGPVIADSEYAEWYELLKSYPDYKTLRMIDLDRTSIVPCEAMNKGWVELRRISYIRRLIRRSWRFITR